MIGLARTTAVLRPGASQALTRAASTFELPRRLPASAFEQHYDGSSSGSANLSGNLLQRLAAALAPTAQDGASLGAPLFAAARLGPALANASGGALETLSRDAAQVLCGMGPSGPGPIDGLEDGAAELQLRGALLVAHGAAVGAPDAASEAGAARAKAALGAVRRLRTAGESGRYATFRAATGTSSRYMQWLALTGQASTAYRARRGVWLTDALCCKPLHSGSAGAEAAWAQALLDAVSAAAQAQDVAAVDALLGLLGDGVDGGWEAAAAEAERHSSGAAVNLAALDLAAAQCASSWTCGGDKLLALLAGAPPGEQALALAHTWLADHTRAARDGADVVEWRLSVPAAAAALEAIQL